MKFQLYGDGIHDDTLAIQELLDIGRSEIVLDAPVKNYLISKTLKIHGGHIEGGCKNGYVANLKGTCHDDLLAITADDDLYGTIENITVDVIFGEFTHSAVRLLSHGYLIKNINIRNVYGTYYTYCIGITKYHGGPEERGKMVNISIENLAASLCEGTKDVAGGRRPLIWVQAGLDIDGLNMEHVYREETKYPTPLFTLEETTVVNRLYMSDIVQKSRLDVPIPLMNIEGEAEDAIIERTYNM